MLSGWKQLADDERARPPKAARAVRRQLRIIEIILQSLKQDLRASKAQSVAAQCPLRGTVRYYEDPYELVAASDWEASA